MTPLDKDIKLGSFGDLDLSFSGGKAQLSLKADVPGAAVTAGIMIVMDATILIDKLKAAIEAKYPASSPIDEAVFALLKSAISSV